MAMFHGVRTRSGPEWDPSLPLEQQSGWDPHAAFMDALVGGRLRRPGRAAPDEHRVVLAVEADSEEEVHATLAPDPWTGSHLETRTVEPWTIRLDGGRG